MNNVYFNHRVLITPLLSLLLLCMLVLGACAPENSAASLLDDLEVKKFTQPQIVNEACDLNQDPHAYRVGPGDKMTINVYKEPPLSGDHTIGHNGRIDLPLVGSLIVSGCSVEQIQNMIHTLYIDGYLVDPSITVSLISYRPFYITGEVRSPGRYDYASDMTVIKAVALASGFTYRANQKEAQILRRTQNESRLYKTENLDVSVRPGDVIFIKERLF